MHHKPQTFITCHTKRYLRLSFYLLLRLPLFWLSLQDQQKTLTSIKPLNFKL